MNILQFTARLWGLEAPLCRHSTLSNIFLHNCSVKFFFLFCFKVGVKCYLWPAVYTDLLFTLSCSVLVVSSRSYSHHQHLATHCELLFGQSGQHQLLSYYHWEGQRRERGTHQQTCWYCQENKPCPASHTAVHTNIHSFYSFRSSNVVQLQNFNTKDVLTILS